MAQEKTTERSFWLDVLRVLLCTGVVVYHYTPERPSSGPMCVDGFFVLSGFLLAAGFDRMQRRGGMDVKAFYRSKAKRLLPTLFASLMLGLAFTITRNVVSGGQLLPGWSGSNFRLATFMEYYNVPSWYMVSELAFLGLAPFLFFLYGLGRKAVLVLVVVMAAYAAMLYSNVPFAEPFGEDLYSQPQTRLWEFSAGILAWMLFARLQLRPWMKIATRALFSIAISLLAALAVIKQDTTLRSLNYTWYFDAAMTTMFMLLIPGLAKLGAPKGIQVQRIFTYAAALTYPVYLYHVPVQEWIYAVLSRIFIQDMEPVSCSLVSLAATIALSVLSLKYLDSLFKKKSAAPAA